MRFSDKLIWAILLFSVLSSASAHQKPSSETISAGHYGKSLVIAAWERLYFDLESLRHSPLTQLTPTEDYLIQRMARLRSILSDQVPQFRPGNDPVFALNPNEEPRSAVTGTDDWEPIIFNLDKILSKEKFSYARAVNLLIHEMGHKIKKDLYYTKLALSEQEAQTIIDAAAGKFQTALENLEKVTSVTNDPDFKILYVNPYRKGRLRIGSSVTFNSFDYVNFHRPYVALVHGEQIYELTESLFFPHTEKERQENPDFKYRHQQIDSLLMIPSGKEGLFLLEAEINFLPLKRGRGTAYQSLYLDDGNLEVIRLPVTLPQTHSAPAEAYTAEMTSYQTYPLADLDLNIEVDVNSYLFKNGQLQIFGKITTNQPRKYQFGWQGSALIIEIDNQRVELPLLPQSQDIVKAWRWSPLKEGALKDQIHYFPILHEPLEIKTEDLPQFKVLGLSIVNYTREEGRMKRFLPLSQSVSGVASPYALSSSGKKHYFQDAHVEQIEPASLYPDTSHLFGIGKKELLLTFMGSEKVQNLKLNFHGKTKDNKFIDSHFLTFDGFKENQFQPMPGGGYQLRVPFHFYSNVSKQQALYHLSSPTPKGFEKLFQLKSIEADLHDGSHYREAFDNGPTLKFHPTIHIPTNEILDHCLKLFN